MLRAAARRANLAAPRAPRRHISTATPLLELPAELVVAVHATTGLPWWCALGATAVLVRTALMPASWLQRHQMQRLVALRPVLAAARREAEASIGAIDAASRASALVAALRRVGVRRLGVPALVVLGVPLVQIPLLIGTIVGVKRMLEAPSGPRAAALREGGAGWAVDLTAADATRALPLASAAVLLANAQLALGGIESAFWSGLRNWMQLAIVVSFPAYATLPSGLFAYLLPHGALSLLQAAFARRAPPPLPPALRAAAAASARRPASAAATTTTTPPAPQLASEVPPATGVFDRARVEALVAESRELLRAKDAGGATALLWPAVQAAPREASAPLRFQLALALALEGQHEPAEALLRQVLELEPTFADAELCLANCLQALGRAAEAADALERAAELKPELRSWCEREAEGLRAGKGGSR